MLRCDWEHCDYCDGDGRCARRLWEYLRRALASGYLIATFTSLAARREAG